MKNIMKEAIRDEKGAALALALVLLVVGGLILTPLLGLMGTGLLAGQVYEERMDLYYAADAGVEDAIWRIQTNSLTFDGGNHSYPKPLTVNGRSVNVTIYRYDWDPKCGENFTYQILSTATSDDGSGTTIDAHLSVSYLDLSALLDNAIVSQDTVWIKGDTQVNGDVWLPDKDDPTKLKLDPNASINGTVKDEDDVLLTWPTVKQLSGYYWEDVKHLDPYPDGYVINIPPGTTEADPYPIGPLYTTGDLTIKGSGWIRVDGTIYVKGTLVFNPTPSINLDLNTQTIFAEGQIELIPGVTLHGSGCIIAVLDIDFQPSIAGDDFVLVLSITGAVFFHPNDDFTGCIAGNIHVQLQPGCTLNWVSPEGKGLKVPWGAGDDDKLPPVTGLSILSWEIN